MSKSTLNITAFEHRAGSTAQACGLTLEDRNGKERILQDAKEHSPADTVIANSSPFYTSHLQKHEAVKCVIKSH